MNNEYGPSLSKVLETQISVSPKHTKFLDRRMQTADAVELAFLDYVAALILRLFPHGVEELAEDYAWLCDQQIEEELYFRRNKRYRLSTFQEAVEAVYADREYMTRYMNGLLMTQLWWSNHSSVMQYYTGTYLSSLRPQARVLEIGPGHGLLSYMAGEHPNCNQIECWDISPASMDLTKDALARLTASDAIELRLVDLFDAPSGDFDAVIFCEILEHMEYPAEALAKLRAQLAPGGSVFINMPINSPAPDHLFNQPSPEALASFIEAAGFEITDHRYFPATNYTLERARAKALTINCVFVAKASSD